MSNAARVDSVDAIRAFRVALIKFAEGAQSSLTEADSEIARKQMWLETEQDSFWTAQIRKFAEQVSKAKEAVRMKKVFKDSFGRTQSVVEEEKVLRQAQKRLAEAETKLVATRAHARQLQREQLLYRGQTQRLQTTLSGDLPNSVALLAAVVNKLDAYAAEAPVNVTSDVGLAECAATSLDAGSMARSADLPAETAAVTDDKKTDQDEGATAKPTASSGL